MEWWNALDFQMQFFWAVSIIGTGLFIIQLALNFLGHDIGADDITTDFELTAEFGIFSLRSWLDGHCVAQRGLLASCCDTFLCFCRRDCHVFGCLPILPVFKNATSRKCI